MGEYSKALSFYERAVNIGQQSLPSNHPDLKKLQKQPRRYKKEIVISIYFIRERIKCLNRKLYIRREMRARTEKFCSC